MSQEEFSNQETKRLIRGLAFAFSIMFIAGLAFLLAYYLIFVR